MNNCKATINASITGI